MRFLASLALAVAALPIACKTPESPQSSSVKDFGEFPAGEAPAFDFASLQGSYWSGNFDAGFPVVATLRVEQDGSGRMQIAADGETQSLDFDHVRAATVDELAQIRQRFGAKFVNSHGAEVTYQEAVVLADAQDALQNFFAVLAADELMVYPMGPMIRQAEAPEADVAKCGGLAGLQCPKGLVCNGAKFDKMGTCVKSGTPTTTQPPPGAVGLPKPQSAPRCGGFAGFQCPPALVCKINPPHPDGMGVCVEAAAPKGKPTTKPQDEADDAPKKCGTLAGLKCPTGHTCKRPKGATADQPGVCVAK